MQKSAIEWNCCWDERDKKCKNLVDDGLVIEKENLGLHSNRS
jgi:hypothetical protein